MVSATFAPTVAEHALYSIVRYSTTLDRMGAMANEADQVTWTQCQGKGVKIEALKIEAFKWRGYYRPPLQVASQIIKLPSAQLSTASIPLRWQLSSRGCDASDYCTNRLS